MDLKIQVKQALYLVNTDYQVPYKGPGDLLSQNFPTYLSTPPTTLCKLLTLIWSVIEVHPCLLNQETEQDSCYQGFSATP